MKVKIISKKIFLVRTIQIQNITITKTLVNLYRNFILIKFDIKL